MSEQASVQNNNAAAQSHAKPSHSGNGSVSMLGINIVGKIFGIVLAVWLISISYYAFLFFSLGMLPAIATAFIDRGVGRFASKTVTATNFMGIAPYLFEVAINSNPTLIAKNFLSDYGAWAFIYGAAMVGWMLIWIVPQLTLFAFCIKASMTIKNYRRQQEELIIEWGEGISGEGGK